MADVLLRPDSVRANTAAESTNPHPLHCEWPSLLLLNMEGLSGIENTANLIEMRLALHSFRRRYGPDYWRVFATEDGVA